MKDFVMESKQLNISIDATVKPFFADEVAVATSIKQEKTPRGKIIKEGVVTLVFLEALGNRAIARVTLGKVTAKSLQKVLKTTLGTLDKELRSKNELKAATTISRASDSGDYIG